MFTIVHHHMHAGSLPLAGTMGPVQVASVLRTASHLHLHASPSFGRSGGMQAHRCDYLLQGKARSWLWSTPPPFSRLSSSLCGPFVDPVVSRCALRADVAAGRVGALLIFFYVTLRSFIVRRSIHGQKTVWVINNIVLAFITENARARACVRACVRVCVSVCVCVCE